MGGSEDEEPAQEEHQRDRCNRICADALSKRVSPVGSRLAATIPWGPAPADRHTPGLTIRLTRALDRAPSSVSDQGAANGFQVLENTTGDEEVADCLTSVFGGMTFPPEAYGREVDFPFTIG